MRLLLLSGEFSGSDACLRNYGWGRNFLGILDVEFIVASSFIGFVPIFVFLGVSEALYDVCVFFFLLVDYSSVSCDFFDVDWYPIFHVPAGWSRLYLL